MKALLEIIKKKQITKSNLLQEFKSATPELVEGLPKKDNVATTWLSKHLHGFVKEDKDGVLVLNQEGNEQLRKFLNETDEYSTPEKFFQKEGNIGKFVPKLLAEAIMEKTQFITLNDTQEVYFYDAVEGIWKPNGETLIRATGTVFLEDKTQQHFLNETLDYIKSRTYKDRTIFDNQNPNFLPLQNGILDIEKRTLLPYNPDFFFTSKLGIKYDPDVDCQKIKKFLSEIVSPDDVNLLIETAGYCLWREYPIQKAVMLVGDGANGKSTYLSLLGRFIGSENIASVSLQDLERNRFASSNLYRKLANIYADLPSVALKNVGLFKMLTGGDIFAAEKKFKNSFQFRNHAKLIFSANQVPYVADETGAFYRRWVIINFPFKFEGDKSNLMILQELVTEDELSGFLNLVIPALNKVLKEGFSYIKSTEEIKRAYIRASDPIAAFASDCLIESPEDVVPKDDVYNSYMNYCRINKLPIVANSAFAKNLRRYVSISETRPKIDNDRVQCWQGIKLVNPVNDVKGASNLNSFSVVGESKIEDKVDIPDVSDNGVCEYCGQHTKVQKFKGRYICKLCITNVA
ncbi:MAG: hypothetical protein HYW23_04200 [Candidatus Aenigmarchaeota archaeon]|nr:hypothetical protein [Candidatus Aenigmarchaeota archaeon]